MDIDVTTDYISVYLGDVKNFLIRNFRNYFPRYGNSIFYRLSFTYRREGMNHPVKKEQCEHEWNTDAYGKPVSCYKCHTKFITSTTSVTSPRPDGWEENLPYMEHEHSCNYWVDASGCDCGQEIKQLNLEQTVKSLLLSQHHKDIEAFRGMIESMIKSCSEVIENPSHTASHDYFQAQVNACERLLTTLSTFASTDTRKENCEN